MIPRCQAPGCTKVAAVVRILNDDGTTVDAYCLKHAAERMEEQNKLSEAALKEKYDKKDKPE